MTKLFLPLLVAVVLLPGCAVRLQPPQYGTTYVQQIKVLGLKVSMPSTAAAPNAGLVKLYLGWVSESVIMIPTISNVNSNGDVSPNKLEIKTPPVATTFIMGESVNPLSTRIDDDFIAGWEGTNMPAARISTKKPLTLRK